jgi:pilus assembly protein CpaB
LALIFGVSAAAGINMVMNQGTEAAQGQTVPVVVATADIQRGVTITPELVKIRNWPKDGVTPGALTKREDVIGRVANSMVLKGEPVLDGRLAAKGAGRGLETLIPKGMQAVTIQTPNVAVGVGGFVLPGHHVDVFLTTPDGGGKTSTVLQEVEVLAVDDQINAPKDNKVGGNMRSVTLLVTPYEAGRLTLAQTKGTLQLSLRNPQDHQANKSRPATLPAIRLDRRVALPINDEEMKLTAPVKSGMVSVVVPIVNIERGMTITGELVQTRVWPKDRVPPGAIAKVEDALDRVAAANLQKAEAILEENLAPKGSGRGLAALVPKGMRAITIPTPSVDVGVGGFVLPGNKVDVLMTKANITSTILQNVEVLAVDQFLNVPSENKVDEQLRCVTLLVSPDQARALSGAMPKLDALTKLFRALKKEEHLSGEDFAKLYQELTEKIGSLRLALRNPLDQERVQMEKPPSKKPRRARLHIRTLRGVNPGRVEVVSGPR